jgi:catechol 2,3-dioxygenase-like lactoylglutathione lyase family enzyme/hemerythrin-like domain-containing protein
MGFHHVSLATKDLPATDRFYRELMGFELVKVVNAPTPGGAGWSRLVFYDTGGNGMMSFWELHDDSIGSDFQTDLSTSLGLPIWVNHVAFEAPNLDAIEARKQCWREHGVTVAQMDFGITLSIYATDPNGILVEFTCPTGAFANDDDRRRAQHDLTTDRPDLYQSLEPTIFPPAAETIQPASADTARSTTRPADAEPRAVVDTRLTHDVHRRATSMMATAAADPSIPAHALADLRDFLVAWLDHHHHSEDTLLWPMILASAPELADEFAKLSSDHERLAAALDELGAVSIDERSDRAALSQVAASLRDLVHSHLSKEEEQLLPALRTHITDEAWDDFARQVVATAPPEGTHFMIGLLDHVGTPDEVALVLLALPAEAKKLLPALRQQARASLYTLQPTQHQ